MCNCNSATTQAEIVGSASVAAGEVIVATDKRQEMVFVGIVPSDGLPEGFMISAAEASRIAAWLWAAAEAASRRARSTA